MITTTFVQEASPQVMEQIAKLTASDAAAGDEYGISVAISGDIAVAGAWKDDDNAPGSGSVYIFERESGGQGAWEEVKKLTPPEAAANDRFGYSVSISGDTLLIGAYMDDSPTTDTGSAYIFERNSGGADNWGQVAKLTASDAASGDLFGSSVSISGDTAVIGARAKNVAAADSGAAYIFRRDQNGPDAWGEVTRLVAFDGAADDFFGNYVSVSGDVVVVGVIYDDDNGANSGSAHIFERDSGGPDAWGNVAKLIALDGTSDDYFGNSVSVHGDNIVIGAYGYDGGAAYIFSRDQGGSDNWGQVVKLTASDAAYEDYFGAGVSISGDIVAVGANRDDDQGEDSGSLYIFTRNEGGPNAWGEAEKHVASDGTAAAGDIFGSSVSINDGLLIAGAMYNDGEGSDAGSAYIFEYTGSIPGEDPELAIPATIPAGVGEVVGVPVELTTNANEIAGVAFSIDFDETCLDFDPTDENADDIPDAIQFQAPVHFDLDVYVDLADSDGEIDVIIADFSETAPLAAGVLADVNFTTTCTPNVGETIIAPVLFSTDPPASFGAASGQPLTGGVVDGSVEIHSGIRGDCNSDSSVDVSDL
ncbi:MAG: hypothetical protein GY859_03470, partial [Desulfobacterales bacterium]|nr:hypothetical protein [Desulfobacterales bacterium]